MYPNTNDPDFLGKLYIYVQEILESNINRLFSDFIRKFPEARSISLNSLYVAGGAIASIANRTRANDYDIFFKTVEDKNKTLEILKQCVNINKNLFIVTDNAITFKSSPAIQFILKVYGNPEEVIQNFDFLHTQNYYDFSTKTLVIKNLEIIKSKELIYNNKATHPLSALTRIYKFMNKGYKIDGVEIIRIIKDLTKYNWNDILVVEEQAKGMYVPIKNIKKLHDETFNKKLEDLINE